MFMSLSVSLWRFSVPTNENGRQSHQSNARSFFFFSSRCLKDRLEFQGGRKIISQN
jgi:hypothetical protein